MIRRIIILAALCVASVGAWAQSLTPVQLTALRTSILASELAAQCQPFGDGPTNIAAAYNQPASPAFIVWRTNVTANEIGNAWVGTDIDGMSALNMQRLQLLLASSPSGVFDMSRADRRAGFENPFGTNANNPSRVAMRAVWQRNVTRFERVFATGTGSTASPGALVVEGALTADVVRQACTQ